MRDKSKLVTEIATEVYRRYFPYLLAVISLPDYFQKYKKYRAIESVKLGFSDHREEQPSVPDPVLDRLINAYHKAKIDQKKVSKSYQVGHLWQGIIDTRFRRLTTALEANDLETIRAILENFNREDCGDDTCGGGQYYQRMRDIPFYKYQFINAWYKRYIACVEAVGYQPDFDTPFVGNPVGLSFDNKVIPLCNIEYRCYAENIKSLLKSTPCPVVCEIGGGVGGQVLETKRSISSLTYILLDIPEVLLLSSYHLMMAFPQNRFLLYGEGELKPRDYDVTLMPNFVLPHIGDCSVDLVFNSCSFSEMDYNTMVEYVSQIERVCETYLLHINHNARLVWYENDRKITNMIASEVVPEGFDLIQREPRVFSLLEDTFVIHLFFKARYYKYLYQRRHTL